MGDILSQEEINALLSSFAKQEEERTSEGDGPDARHVRPYDFRRPDKLSKDQLRAIEMLHGTFARMFSSWMASYLRASVRGASVACEQLSFDEFASSLATPGVIAVFGMGSSGGEAILWFAPALAFAILDRRLGGPGQARGKMRELTDIERGIMRGVILKILELLAVAWNDVYPFTAHLIDIVSSPEYARVTADNETVCSVTMETALGETSGNIGICFPYPLLQPVVPRLSTSRRFGKDSGRHADGRVPEAIKKGIAAVKVPVIMELGRANVSVGDFIDLAPGDIIRLDSRRGDDLVVRIGGNVKFLARPGIIGKRLALQVSSVMRHGGGGL